MMRIAGLAIGVGVVGVIGGLLGGCVLDPWAVRPTRFHVGPTMRAVNVPGDQPISGTVQKTAATEMMPADSAPLERSAATSVDLQFETRFAHQMYLGIEGEAGKVAADDADIGGAYAVVGGEHAL